MIETKHIGDVHNSLQNCAKTLIDFNIENYLTDSRQIISLSHNFQQRETGKIVNI
jgi:hypothetical protein